MLEFYSDYLIKQAFDARELNEKFTFEDMLEGQDLSYLSQEGRELLKKLVIQQVDENKNGLIKLQDSQALDGIIFKKVARKVKNENYFANKIY